MTITTVPVIRCLGQVQDCLHCRCETPRGGTGHVCDDLCELQREIRRDPGGHARSHEPKVHDCGAVLDDRHGTNYERVEFCGWGTCVQFLCPGCGGFVSGYGPAGCQCESDYCGHGSYQSFQPAPAVESRRRRMFSLPGRRRS